MSNIFSTDSNPLILGARIFALGLSRMIHGYPGIRILVTALGKSHYFSPIHRRKSNSLIHAIINFLLTSTYCEVMNLNLPERSSVPVGLGL